MIDKAGELNATITANKKELDSYNVVRLYYYTDDLGKHGEVEDCVELPEVIYLMIKDGVVDVC